MRFKLSRQETTRPRPRKWSGLGGPWSRAAGGVLVLVLSTWGVLADMDLVLIDGRVLSGKEVRREGDVYVLVLEDGGEMTFAVELVETVKLTGRGEPRAPRHPGVVRADPRELAGRVPDGPTGIRTGQSRTLAGDPVVAPSTADQLRVLGPKAEFQGDIIDSRWTPSSDWKMDPANNNFNPSTWSKSVIDPSWEPKSAFDADKDVLAPGNSTFQKGVVDSTWKPTDAFAR